MSKKAEALTALKAARIEETEAAISKLNANMEDGMVTVTNPKTKAKTRKAMTNDQRAKKQEQRDKLASKLASLQGLAPKASRSRPSKKLQMNSNLASGTLYCYKATPEGKRGADLDGALIGEEYVLADELMDRWGKKVALKPTASRAPSRGPSRAASPTGGPGANNATEGGARRRRRTMRRKASRKASRSAKRKASRKASRKSRKTSRKH
jgi:hypothetical protein